VLLPKTTFCLLFVNFRLGGDSPSRGHTPTTPNDLFRERFARVQPRGFCRQWSPMLEAVSPIATCQVGGRDHQLGSRPQFQVTLNTRSTRADLAYRVALNNTGGPGN